MYRSVFKQSRTQYKFGKPSVADAAIFDPNTGRVEEELLAKYDCCALRFELRNTGLSTNEF